MKMLFYKCLLITVIIKIKRKTSITISRFVNNFTCYVCVHYLHILLLNLLDPWLCFSYLHKRRKKSWGRGLGAWRRGKLLVLFACMCSIFSILLFLFAVLIFFKENPRKLKINWTWIDDCNCSVQIDMPTKLTFFCLIFIATLWTTKNSILNLKDNLVQSKCKFIWSYPQQQQN